MPATHPPEATDLRALTARFLADQAEASARLGSHLYAALLAGAADDVRRGGVTWAVLAPHASPDRGAAITLRFMAAVHRLVLQGKAPELAACYPSVGGHGRVEGTWEAFRSTVEAHEEELRELVGW